MDHAEVHRKVPEGVRDDEDILTSTAFGLLELLPPERVLLPWLRMARTVDGSKPPLDHPYIDVIANYWPRFPEFGDRTEMDLLLVLCHSSGAADLAAIEVKYRSGPSGWPVAREINKEVRGQLGREWSIVSRLPAQRVSGAATRIDRRLLFYLTPEPSQPRDVMRQMANEVASKANDAAMLGNLFWLSWLDLFVTVEKALKTAQEPVESKVLSRLDAYLRARRLESFGGVLAPGSVEVNWIYQPRRWNWAVGPSSVHWAYVRTNGAREGGNG